MNLKKNFALFLSAVTCLTAIPMLPQTTAQAAASYPVQRFRMGISDTNRNVNAEDSAVKSAVQNGTSAENWTLNYVSGGVFEIVSTANGRILTSSGADVALADDTDGANQRWRIEGVQKDYDGYDLYYKIVSNADASQALTFSADSNSFYMSSYSGDAYQKFKINLTGCDGFAANCMTESGEKAGTIGGLFGETVYVSKDTDLISYLNSTEPYTIVVDGTIDMQPHQKTRIRDNKTLIGSYSGGKLIDCELRTNNEYGLEGDNPSDNIVIQNIDFLAKNERGRILVQIWSSRQIWIDHCSFISELSRDVDEVGKFIWINTPYETYMDKKDRLRSPDYITISYCIFRNRFWTVAYGTQNDEYSRCRTSVMYNWWDECVRRCPQIGNGNMHVVNNYYSGNDNGNDQSTDQIIGGDHCNIVSENCRFQSLKGDEIVAGTAGDPYRDTGSYTSDTANSTPYPLNFKTANTSTWYPDQSNYGYAMMDAYNTNGTDTKDFCLKYTGHQNTVLTFLTDSNMNAFVSTQHESPFLKTIDVMDGKPGAVFDTAYTYTFCNAASGLYLEVADALAQAGANVQQGAAGARNWKLQDAGNGYYKIYSEVGDGKTFLLDLDYGKPDNGTNIGIWSDTESDAQLFKFVANGDGTYCIVTKASRDKSGIGIDGGSIAVGANAIQWALDGSDNQKWFPAAVIETGSTLIRDLSVSDMANVSGWGYDASAETGDLVYGDRDAAFTSIPDTLLGAERILTACDSKNTVNTLASFTAGADMTVYVGLDARVGNPPAWLADYTKTDMTAVNSKDVTFVLYEKEFRAGDTVWLSENGQSSGCVNYAVFAKEAKTEPERITGDVNADGMCNVVDVVMLQKWLMAVPDAVLTDGAAADLHADGRIDAFDLALLKRFLLERN